MCRAASAFMCFLSSIRNTEPRTPGLRSSRPRNRLSAISRPGATASCLVHGLDARLAGVHRALEVHDLAVEPDLARVRDQRAAQGLDQAGLARAVVTDDREDLAGVELEVAAGDRGDLAVALDQALGLQHRLARWPPGIWSFVQRSGAAHAFTFRIHWSRATAMSTSTTDRGALPDDVDARELQPVAGRRRRSAHRAACRARARVRRRGSCRRAPRR